MTLRHHAQPSRLLASALAIGLALTGVGASAQDYSAPAISRAPAPVVSAYPASQTLARVISATPNIERIVETRQQCTEPWQAPPASASSVSPTTASLMGAVIGGAAGSALGKGNGRLLGVAAGSVIGSQVGRSMAEPAPVARPAQICQPVNTVREQVRDYSVRYEWDGREYQISLPQHPGQWLRVNTSHTVQVM